ncbi:TerB family tellurite resistance protein [Ramlibacter humi]|uniref:TerB family tellurite resistance protein n=1 Tax=Ramlibacter humi TaxID=2530451 RepID=A0A4Z0BPQ6_9BURK|nr:TerB family tellurite resistance protein [Ramlibacter humi]TFZ00228.1 TerB family tellurite resistance protein [Ramlibacter humi]
MFQGLRDFLDSLTDGLAEPHPDNLPLACAVLLVEVMRAEPQVSPAARQAVMAGLRRRFRLGDEALTALIAMAEQASRHASDFHQFTSQLNDALDNAAKIAVVESMWQVAYADGALGDHEQHLISRIAGLLNVTHGEYIAAKMRAKEAAGL